MVSNVTLAAICVSSGLHEHLLFESPSLSESIKTYATALKVKQIEEYALAKSEDRQPGQFWAELEPPKALSDVLESIIGAVYVSDSFLPMGSEKIFDKILRPFYDQHITLQSIAHHPTKVLYELVQAAGCHALSFDKSRDKENANLHRCTGQLVSLGVHKHTQIELIMIHCPP
jgi:endoribonuclease Dicer